MAKPRNKSEDIATVDFLAAHNHSTRAIIQLLVYLLEGEGVLEQGQYRALLIKYAEAIKPGPTAEDRRRHKLTKQLLGDFIEMITMDAIN
jgi:hypothetical protein